MSTEPELGPVLRTWMRGRTSTPSDPGLARALDDPPFRAEFAAALGRFDGSPLQASVDELAAEARDV